MTLVEPSGSVAFNTLLREGQEQFLVFYYFLVLLVCFGPTELSIFIRKIQLSCTSLSELFKDELLKDSDRERRKVKHQRGCEPLSRGIDSRRLSSVVIGSNSNMTATMV